MACKFVNNWRIFRFNSIGSREYIYISIPEDISGYPVQDEKCWIFVAPLKYSIPGWEKMTNLTEVSLPELTEILGHNISAEVVRFIKES